MGKVDKTKFKMLAKCFYGFEEILAKELLSLGAQKIQTGRRNVSFYGDKGFMYKANLSLRTALKILKPISEFKFGDINSFYDKIYNIKWESLLGVNSAFIINSSVFHSKIFNIKNTFDIFSSNHVRSMLVSKPCLLFDLPLMYLTLCHSYVLCKNF